MGSFQTSLDRPTVRLLSSSRFGLQGRARHSVRAVWHNQTVVLSTVAARTECRALPK